MTNDQSYLRFSLEESVWFQKGQEVGELFSLAIDPNVTIVENDQYVNIKGFLELSGEYRGSGISQVRETGDISPSSFHKTIQNVLRDEQGISTFTHAFPVDISIPANRISSLDEVNVMIQTFDYTMPENNCLKLSADLCITGIYGEQQFTPKPEPESYHPFQAFTPETQEVFAHRTYEEEDVEEYENEESAQAVEPILYREEYENEESVQVVESILYREEDEYEPFSAEATKLPREDDDEEESYTESTFVYQNENLEESTQKEVFTEFPVFHYEEEELEDEEQEFQVRQDYQVWQETPTANHPYYQEDYSQRIEEAEEQRISNQETSEVDDVEVEEVERFEEVEVVDEVEEISYQESPRVNTSFSVQQYAEKASNAEVENQAPVEEKRSHSASVSLTDFFGKKETQDKAILKVCIIQHGENLHEVASRYQVPVQVIIKKNDLDDENDIYEGQVLYIPQVVANRK
ncbi:LysM peptidoglycan-binding domain-containing protein [Peribacillus alkalitolerans]|uniref:LysM peptidoglycan-binding domain-containing protein n=1 Tax=Peribacillus alkalitolerans TaxID=1550385 RepID=UPI0013D115BA|nr:LysM peptidoglycan-binding domain-containing protein [Peribacillus alkalitolerans]